MAPSGDMVMEEEYAKKTLQKNKKMRKISEQRIARKIKRLSNKKLFDEDGNEIVDSSLEAWEEYDNEQFFEEYDGSTSQRGKERS